MFVRLRGKTKTMHFKNVDTAVRNSLKQGSLVTLNDSGQLSYCSNDSTDRPIGVCRQTVSRLDTTQLSIPVEVPMEKAVEWLIDTDTVGGAVDSDVGRYCAVDTGTAGDCEATRVDISDTTIRQIYISRIISGTQIVGTISRMAWEAIPFDTSA